ncbi:hypothetical protein CC86DRAFT_360096 [Ophiobolus disseminans]|uniref:Hybrid NRPS/PKS enzyme n=1 Tax=Ophiobolus disseminans TaxID=1469910 RepID=A0A6A6ZJJ5_9PLEO|nr:hypothetical protein CC86DRAFT_360096 [Ophiobolus disseminans]
MPYTNEPIAVVGSGCRFPGNSSSPSKLWDLLQDPRDVQRKIDRFRADNFYNKDGHYHGASNVLSAYLLDEDPKLFDSQFFNIPLSEAESIDPQQRVLMETVYESLEAAGISVESLSESNTAVYVGVMCNDFEQIVYGDPENVPTYASTGSHRSILSNRISYFFNWHGPSMTIDTACSSSLVAVHQAVQALRSGEAPVAVAAGSNLIFTPTMFVSESNLNMLSSTGRSRMWDAGANGYARGEGVGSIIMKTLSSALRDGDHIEYIIRETGINQDGKTPGITMPSSELQATLIRDTYARAGLDPLKRRDRCQYFEAHGTGTPAGDPQEAGAIYRAFYADKKDASDHDDFDDEDILHVGSIKTIIGHTEGTAGIAGMMKAGLAIQNKAIPPNMHFTKLNPDIEPFYSNLQVPVQLRDWPDIPIDVPRRASVNSFGFGGANAHAIIESYEPEKAAPRRAITATLSPTPYSFVFSGTSEKSLVAQLRTYLAFLDDNLNFDLGRLSWTLFRRTALSYRVAFSADSVSSLAAKIAEQLEKAEKKEDWCSRANPKTPHEILGVFTGQGAQWATMGRELIIASHFAESIVNDLEASLAELSDAPEWSLKAEMLASKENSRIAEGVISQPLCLAVQVMVVELLRQAGVRFSAVVGHSSGEIACAYVSGLLSAKDAIRVAFYRGKYTPLAKGGSMIASGTDMQDAIDLCSLPKLKGRAQFAASNSSSSVTISGDADAIDLVEMVMQDESKFVRKLKVDTAYHSFHMRVCSEPYIESLEKCGIQILDPAPDACPWYSSVTDGNERVTMDAASVLQSTYWRDNMLNPVLFSQALQAAVASNGIPGLVLEVGPHPALKGPASTTIEEAVGSSVPYFGTLARGQNDAIALTNTIGSIWTILGASDIDFQGYHRAISKDAMFEVSKKLPTYTWDHEKAIWGESRVSKTHRLRTETKHELLGVRLSDEVEGELRWRNYLKPKEMPWTTGHKIQGQMVFPAAGFATMALEAARNLAPFETIRLMELQNFSIHKGLSFFDENSSVETIFILSNILKQDGAITADFGCNACLNKDAGDFSSMASGKVLLTIGEPSKDALPERPHWPNNFVDTNVEYFYEELANLGYGYEGMFQGVTELHRTNSGSKGVLNIPQDPDSAVQNWVVHPATLDVAFQAVFAAVGAPGDGRLWTLHVPTMINSITVNPSAFEDTSGVETPLPFDACLVNAIDEGIAGDIDVYEEGGKQTIVQIQGLNVTPLSKPTPDDDRETFAAMDWEPALPSLATNWTEAKPTADEEKIANFAERLSLLVLRDLCKETTINDVRTNGTENQRAFVDWAEHIIDTVRAGEHPTCPKQWLADTWEILQEPAERYAPSNPQVQACLDAKSRLRLYMKGRLSADDTGFGQGFLACIPFHQAYVERLGDLVNQISFRHRNMRILEIGTGDGFLATKILGTLGDNFTSYTCTNVDEAHFDNIRSQLDGPYSARVLSMDLDVGEDPTEQGFNKGYYDLVLAGNTLHDARDLRQSLIHIRSLMRPGAHLAFLEPTSSKSLAVALGGCLSSNWFAGVEEERKHSPLLSQQVWDDFLRDAGFSGIDTSTPEERTHAVPFSVMCSMATDGEMDLIRDPLAFTGQKKFNNSVLIIGGATMRTKQLVRGVEKALSPFFQDVVVHETMVTVDAQTIASAPTTINLGELDEPLFRPFTEEKFKAAVKLCDNLQSMLWVTVGSRGEDPYMNMMTAVGRCLEGEMPSLRLQFLNFDGNDRPTPETLAYHLLRLHMTHGINARPGTKKAGEPLYTIERELTIQNGTLLIPRYIFSDTINTRLNSDRRLITHNVEQDHTAVELDTSNTAYKLLERELIGDHELFKNHPADIRSIRVTVTKGLLNAIKINAAGCFHVVIGRTSEDSKVIALSEHNQSLISVPDSQVIEVDVDDGDEQNLLLQVAAELLAGSILSDATGSVLVHEPSQALANSLSGLWHTGKSVTITSTSPTVRGATVIHPSSPDRALARAVPQDTTLFADFSQNGSRLDSFLPIGCTPKTTTDYIRPSAYVVGTIDADVLPGAVRRAFLSYRRWTEEPDVTPASELHEKPIGALDAQIVDWTADKTLPVAVEPADVSTHFRSNRTYFMVGLAGELGLQTIKWMVSRGAKYIALSSRNPKVDAGWLEYVASQGATVKLYAMDVTSRDSVRAVHKQICAEMPPIAGVMNGAMILIDALFSNNDFATFDKVLRPKVDGTVYLDEVFNNNDLDFFIVTSSLASVSGNIGQTAYAAANAFMCSLIAGRRMRGLAGSALNMPGIVGLGYLNRDPRKLWRLKKIGYVNISEWEFFQFFSEAIVAGRPDSGLNPEITAGLQRSDVSTVEDPPHWFLTHRFSTLHKVPASGGDATDGDKDGATTRNKLAELTNEKDVNSTILEDLINVLYTRLNMDPSANAVTSDTAIVELGVDSLLAVDIRAWFTKELDLDMPVLKILGGATVQELVDDAVGRLDSQLVPKLARDGEKQTTSGDEPAAPTNDPAADAALAESTSIEESSSAEELAEEVLTVAPLDLPVIEEADDLHSDVAEQDWSTASDSPSSRGDDSSDAAESSSGTQTPITEDTDSEPEEPKQKEENAAQQEVAEEVITSEERTKPIAKLFSNLPIRPAGELEFVKKAQMSHGTSRFWFLMQYIQDPTSFNLLAHLKCTGHVDFNTAEKAVRELGNRHEIFRTAFFADETRGNEPTMGVMKESPLQLECRSPVTEGDIDAEVDELLNYEFKLEQGETIRAKILSLDENTHHVLFAFHHIAMDGFSFNILLAEVNQLYDGQKLAPVSMQFTDFADRQRKQIADGSLDGEFQFWKDMYSQKLPSGEIKPDFPEPLPLFNLAQSTRQSLDNYEFEEASVVLDSRILRQIKTQCKKHKITPFHFFLGVLRTFLFRQLDVDDLVIGIADANRTDDSVASTIGFMLNLLPLRFKNDVADQNISFKDVAAEARKTAYDGLAHSKLPFDALLEKLNIPRSATHSPLYQVFLDFRPFRPEHMPTMFGGEASGDQTVGRNGYDLTLDVNEIDGSETRVSFRTQKYLYSADATQALFDSYMRLVRSFADDFEVPVGSVSLWEEKELESARTLGKGSEIERQWPETLSHRIANIASQWPDKEAVKDGNGKLCSYTQLQHRVQAISDTLTQAGVTQGSRVAVFQHPSVEWVCSLLGIWHAGGTYIPMDLKNSLPRLAAIAAAAKPAVILCHDETESLVPELKSSASHLVNVSSLQHAQPITKVQARANGTAAILFTSGSTGTPKGVILRHSAFRNTIEGLTQQYAIGAEKVLQQSAFTFDFSLDQIMCGLVNGGTVYVATKQDRADPVAIAKIIASENISYTRATPSEYASWIKYGAEHLTSATSWKFAWGGGETMPQSLPESIAGLGLQGLRLFNSYGPAESITCTKTEVSLDFDADANGLNDTDIPAGYPLPNYSVYIVDRNLDLVPQGSTGEILIGGPSVSAGYLNQEKLSASKFISNPWDTGIVYRTGDTGYLRPDGALMFKGRIAGDTQIKIRGIRIDLQDIESCILEASDAALHKVIVSVRDGDVLVAHVQFADGQYDDEASQQAFLRQMRFLLPLPVYMIPAVFVPLDQLPVTSHGKTDRRAVSSLPLPTAHSHTATRSDEDLTKTERKLIKIWMESVPKEMAGSMVPSSQTSFFELGGNSLLLVSLQRAVEREFGVKLGIVDLFEASSLGGMAGKIESMMGEA